MRQINSNRRYALQNGPEFWCIDCTQYNKGCCKNFCAFQKSFRTNFSATDSARHLRLIYLTGNSINYEITIKIKKKVSKGNLIEYIPSSKIISIWQDAISSFNVAAIEFMKTNIKS